MPIKTVDPETLKHWLAQGHAVLVDVREPVEYRAGHIAGAHHIPLAKLNNAHLPIINGALVLHCLKGGRGASACEMLMKKNPEFEVYNLEGGITAWTAAGLPTQSTGPGVLPLDRQVQLAIGLVLLASSYLALFWSPLFIFVVMVAGTGLTVAGATGFCGLARLMAQAPWNH